MLGTGIAARQLYWPELQRLNKRIQVVACCNRTKSKAQAFAADCNIGLVTDTAEELFALPNVDAVLISLPIADQPRYVLKALKAGKHVLSEKPMAPSLAAGRALVKAAKPYQKRGLKWMVGENYAFLPQVIQAEAWLAEGALGDVRVVEVRQMSIAREDNPYVQTLWRLDPRFVGGFVMDAGVHLAHIVRRYMGFPVELKSLNASFNPMLQPIDSTLGVLRFRSGAVGSWISCFSAQGGHAPMITLRGSRADLEIHRDHAVLLAHVGKPRTYKAPHDSFYGQFHHFADVVNAGARLAYTPADALADLAFMQSLVQGRLQRP